MKPAHALLQSMLSSGIHELQLRKLASVMLMLAPQESWVRSMLHASVQAAPHGISFCYSTRGLDKQHALCYTDMQPAPHSYARPLM